MSVRISSLKVSYLPKQFDDVIPLPGRCNPFAARSIFLGLSAITRNGFFITSWKFSINWFAKIFHESSCMARIGSGWSVGSSGGAMYIGSATMMTFFPETWIHGMDSCNILSLSSHVSTSWRSNHWYDSKSLTHSNSRTLSYFTSLSNFSCSFAIQRM